MLIHPYLLSDTDLLNRLSKQLFDFLTNKEGIDLKLDLDHIKRVTYNNWNKQNYRLSDRIFSSYWEMFLNRKEEIGSLTLSLLDEISNKFIELDRNHLSIKSENFGEWQDIISYFSPLPFIAYKLSETKDNKQARSFLGGSLLLSPYHPLLENFINEEGLNETHLHLNGTTIVEKFWNFALDNPSIVYLDLKNNNVDNKEHVRLLYFQDYFLKEPDEYFRLLSLAKYIRDFISNLNDNKDSYIEFYKERDKKCCHNLLVGLKRYCNKTSINTYIEDSRLDPNKYEYAHLEEIDFHVEFIRKIKENPKLDIVYLIYLICMNCFYHLAVQSADQYGFDQFQKIADNGVREYFEKSYLLRFKQIYNRSDIKIGKFEGRFAPKDSLEKNENIIRRILAGFMSLQDGKPEDIYLGIDINILANMVREIKGKNFSLVAHFIKKKWNRKEESHFESLRKNLDISRECFIQLFQKYPNLKHIITGVDVASNELEAPPEVFASLYSYLRDKDIQNFTYHVGEDFEHLLSGIRYIYDAIMFLELRNGDRIGHATAIGIDPEFWLNEMPDSIMISQGEWLENLLFLRKVLISQNDLTLYCIDQEISQLAYNIFNEKENSIVVLEKYFENRHLTPVLVKDFLSENRSGITSELRREYNKICALNNKDVLQKLNKRWFDKKTIENYDKRIEIALTNLTKDLLVKAQQYVQKIIFDKNIIIESLPTSNVRISHYKTMSEHHIFRWLSIPERAIPGDYPISVSLGSDDPGIFSTDIKNEVYHIFCVLIHKFKLSQHEALNKIKMLNDTGSVYSFRYQDLN